MIFGLALSVTLSSALPIGPQADKQMTYASKVLDMYFDGRMRASDPTVITVYHFVDAVYEGQPPLHKISKDAFPKAQLLINMVDNFLISGDIFREELPTDGAKLEFMRGLCRLISWKYQSPSQNVDPKEFRAMASRSFKKGTLSEKNISEGALDFRNLCKLGLVWTNEDVNAAQSLGESLAKSCQVTDRWLGIRASLAVVERLRSAGRLGEARLSAGNALVTFWEFKEWDTCKRLVSFSSNR